MIQFGQAGLFVDDVRSRIQVPVWLLIPQQNGLRRIVADTFSLRLSLLPRMCEFSSHPCSIGLE